MKNGSDDIRKHRWFQGVDWQALYLRKIDAPIIVQVSSAGDSHYFEDYQNSFEDQTGPLLTEEQHALFANF